MLRENHTTKKKSAQENLTTRISNDEKIYHEKSDREKISARHIFDEFFSREKTSYEIFICYGQLYHPIIILYKIPNI